MKRTITLIAIALMAIAPLASAAIVSFELDSSAVVGAGNTVTVNLVADGLANGYGISGVSDGAAGGSVANLTTALSVIDAGFVDNNIEGGIGYLFSAAAASAANAQTAGTVLFSFDYTISSSWDGASAIVIAPLASGATYYWSGGSFPAAASTVNIEAVETVIGGLTIVPEPMTMGLLGLGGLFLARRKKA